MRVDRAPDASAELAGQGLTHPADDKRWFGFTAGDHFFRLVDGDSHVAVLLEPKARRVVDTIRFNGDAADPREALATLATHWLQRQRSVRRAPARTA